MSDLVEGIFEFEPNASAPLFIRAVDRSGQVNTSSAESFLSVSTPTACIPIQGVYDAAREGYSFDLNELADHLQPGSYTAYIYIRWSAKPVRVASMKLKAVGGCVWQPLN